MEALMWRRARRKGGAALGCKAVRGCGFGFVLLLSACGDPNTATKVVTVALKSDTTLVRGSETPRGGDTVLEVAHAGGEPSKVALLALPSEDGTATKDSIIGAIIEAIFDGSAWDGCDRSKILKPQYLSSVKLVVTPTESGVAAAQAALLSVKALSRGWWQGATWTRAHPFLSSGAWETPGGDLRDDVTPATGTTGSVGTQETIEFEVKDFVREDADGEIPGLYGFRVEGAAGADLELHSAQSSWGADYAPYLEFTYVGPCVRSTE